uniref:Carboxylic ester hydrolase n=1 Tax=Sciurus vulgaris TaxID=55149 RepID=A0A8D2DYE9_SCIVU
MIGDWVYPGQALIWAIWILATVIRGPMAQMPERDTMLGRVQGKQVNVMGNNVAVNVFLGIPYAAPPVGPLRFKDPQPPSPWNDLRQATTYPDVCYQDKEWLASQQDLLRVHYPKFGMSEDCLYLNIYAPSHADRGSNLPVMVWFPGGGFQGGSASIFDGSSLAAYENVVIVNIQYRLGIFGFFSTRNEYASGNWAFKDQVAALTWVKENIDFFGGNPNSVTIFGESSGAISVSNLILSPKGKGLFHRAIMESGVAIIPQLKSLEVEKKEDLQIIAEDCGFDISNSQALLNCLRSKTAKELLVLSQKASYFTRVVDGVFFSEDPMQTLTKKSFNPIPCIIGVNNNECGFLLPMTDTPEILKGYNKTQAMNVLQSFLHISTKYMQNVSQEYFAGKDSVTDIRDSFLDLLGDVFFMVPGIVTARHHRDAGSAVYFYEFQHRPLCFEKTKPAFVKADHTDEIRFVFGGAFLKSDIVMFDEATEEEKKLSRTMMKYWTNFARTGNPNGEGVPNWPIYDKQEQYLVLDVNVKVEKKLKESKVQFWTRISMIMSPGDLISPHFSLIFFSLPVAVFFSLTP